jgi:hypothetical protein
MIDSQRGLQGAKALILAMLNVAAKAATHKPHQLEHIPEA